MQKVNDLYDYLFRAQGNWKIIHISLLILRFICIFLPGYPHPDEFFQSQEVAAADVFNFNVFIPWEFTPSNPCRSIFPPLVGSGIAFSILEAISFIIPSAVNGYTLLYLPRIVIFLLSLTLDYTAATICYWVGKSSGAVLSVLSSSWVMLVFHTRPFSNTVESILLACSFIVFFLPKETLTPSQRDWRYIGIGIIFSLGIFTRFTYCLFFFPIALSLLYEFYTFEVVTTGWEASGVKIKKISRVKSIIRSFILITLGFATVSALIILLDSIYFGGIQITVLNSFFYNLDSSNLAQHGLHPRYLHALVNMNILYGPLYLCGIVVSAILLFEVLKSFFSKENPAENNNEKNNNHLSSKYLLRVSAGAHGGKSRRNKEREKMVRIVLLGSIISGTFLLSMAVHQEPRFLVPLLLPFAVLFGDVLVKNKYLLFSWILFNLFFFCFYGILHQGGVIPSLLYFQQSDLSNTKLVYYNTYMPPRFLLAQTFDHPNLFLLDAGTKIENLNQILADHTEEFCHYHKVNSHSNNPPPLLYIITPNTTQLPPGINKSDNLVHQFWPHFSSESPPTQGNLIQTLSLDVIRYNPLC